MQASLLVDKCAKSWSVLRHVFVIWRQGLVAPLGQHFRVAGQSNALDARMPWYQSSGTSDEHVAQFRCSTCSSRGAQSRCNPRIDRLILGTIYHSLHDRTDEHVAQGATNQRVLPADTRHANRCCAPEPSRFSQQQFLDSIVLVLHRSKIGLDRCGGIPGQSFRQVDVPLLALPAPPSLNIFEDHDLGDRA